MVRVVAVAFLMVAAAGCAGPLVADADDVIAMKRGGADDAALLSWAWDPRRTFDVDSEGIGRLKREGVPMEVIDVIRSRSDERHRQRGEAPGKSHKH